MAAKETDRRNPSWHWWESEDASRESAMRADARVTSHPIRQHVADERQADNAFDSEITYSKGEAVLRMLEAYLGSDAFREGVRGLMRDHAFSNATTADLWNALGAASGRSIGDIAAGWISQPGFPVVSVAASCDADGRRSLKLSQKRFLLRGADPKPSHWSVPLQIRSGIDGAAQAVLLTRDGQVAQAGRCDEALSINADALGFYRSQYDAATLRTNTLQFADLPRRDRIALLDDEWALAEAGVHPLAAYLELASALGPRLEERAWTQVADALGTIEYVERGTPGHDDFAAYARSLIKPVADRLGWDSKPGETPAIQSLRRALLVGLGSWGDPEIIAEARRRFAAFAADRGAIRPDDQTTVLTITSRYADGATFEQLHAIAKSARDETELRRFYSALMLVRDPQLAARAARIALSAEIPEQAAALRLRLLGELSRDNPQISWAAFTGNLEAVTAPYAPMGPMMIAQYAPEMFWKSVPLDQLEAWVRAHVPREMADDIARGMETARFKLGEKSALVRAADQYLASRPQDARGGSGRPGAAAPD
jgi:aminopeptidase N